MVNGAEKRRCSGRVILSAGSDRHGRKAYVKISQSHSLDGALVEIERQLRHSKSQVSQHSLVEGSRASNGICEGGVFCVTNCGVENLIASLTDEEMKMAGIFSVLQSPHDSAFEIISIERAFIKFLAKL